jgi:alpha-amylase/alpha-mannosidase (GH57 family)
MPDPLYVSLLWHMHQPYYKDPVQGEYILPWTYLHAVKDYYDMAAIVDDAPDARVVFNLVPSLLEQIEEYAAGQARDPFLVRARMSPSDMGEGDKIFLLENFFSANRQRMIEPYPRYLELYCMAGDGAPGAARDRLCSLTDQDLLDLQVWFYLTWTGPMARRRFPAFRELIRKGKNFSAADKLLLFETQRELMAQIVPLYRKLHDAGKAELSVTPYFHPILPLICDTSVARDAMPKVRLPEHEFRSPEDARRQVAQGIESFRRIFGFAPQGMWPSEGSVSDEALSIMAGEGIRWSASDELVLGLSLPGGLGRDREDLYHPYRFSREGREIDLLFRDHGLSDQIGFAYSRWEPQRAVADFIGRLKEVRQRCRSCRVVPVILDGENAWEYYQDNGLPFLTRLYRALGQTPGLQAATFSEVLQLAPERRTLDHVHPGSWINANYGIWIGHPEENLGWDHLARARAAAVARSPAVASLLAGDAPDDADATSALICKSLYAAQGSDWFWWFGDDHFSAHAASFDLLFRRHLMNVYRLLDLEVPGELYHPIKKQLAAGFVRDPAALITPAITGIVSDYSEWLGAGLYDLTKQSSAMHAAESLLQAFFYGFDGEFFYFRIDGVRALEKLLQQEDRLSLHLIHGIEFRTEMELGECQTELELKGEQGWTPCGTRVDYSIGRIVEARIPLSALHLAEGDRLFAYLTYTRGRDELGRWPLDAPLLLNYAGTALETQEKGGEGEANAQGSSTF